MNWSRVLLLTASGLKAPSEKYTFSTDPILGCKSGCKFQFRMKGPPQKVK